MGWTGKWTVYVLGILDRWTVWTDRRHLTDWETDRKEGLERWRAGTGWTDGQIGQMDELDMLNYGQIGQVKLMDRLTSRTNGWNEQVGRQMD